MLWLLDGGRGPVQRRSGTGVEGPARTKLRVGGEGPGWRGSGAGVNGPVRTMPKVDAARPVLAKDRTDGGGPKWR